MATNKKGFVLYCDLIHTLEHLTIEQRGQVFTWILDYVNDKNPKDLEGLLAAVVEPIKQQLKRDLKHWEDVRRKRSAAGKKGGRPKAKKANANSDKQTEAKKAVIVTDTVTVKETDKDILLSKFSNWAIDSGLDANKVQNQFLKAWDYYNELGWCNKYGKPIKNRYTTIRNNWFKDLNDFKPKLNIDALVLHCAMQAPEEMQKLCNKYQVNQQVIEQLYHDSRKQ